MKPVPSAVQDQRQPHTLPSPSKAFKMLPDTLNKSISLQQKESKHQLAFLHVKRLRERRTKELEEKLQFP